MEHVITHCRVCGNEQLETMFDLGRLALTGVFPKTEAEQVPVGSLRLVKCRAVTDDNCGLVQLGHTFDPTHMFGANYGYRSGLNRSMVDHLGNIAAMLKKTAGLDPGDLVIDIGSNDSTLLRAIDEPGLTLVGIDPSGA